MPRTLKETNETLVIELPVSGPPPVPQPSLRPAGTLPKPPRRLAAGTIPPVSRSKRRAPKELGIGSRIGPWLIERELGRGGMGRVYAVAHSGFGKRAALKVCHTSMIDRDLAANTFLREARIVNLIDHPAVPDVFATGTFENRPYLAMERLQGETLRQLWSSGALSQESALEILVELCGVLQAAHDAGVVHRDLTLDNVFVLDKPGAGGCRIKLLDWGFARVLAEDDPLRGHIAGTMTYVAPEAIVGREVSPASDVYALGVLAYILLLGQAPFAADELVELAAMHLHQEPPAPQRLRPAIRPELEQLLLAMLAKEPSWRPVLAEIQRELSARPRRRRRWLQLVP
ncbi:MAG TPA: serine/threonine-protein kinase [Kofleriaceae bacterium]|nr:serine/threonine-protein kinase [Kofleriaceae bacterium]